MKRKEKCEHHLVQILRFSKLLPRRGRARWLYGESKAELEVTRLCMKLSDSDKTLTWWRLVDWMGTFFERLPR